MCSRRPQPQPTLLAPPPPAAGWPQDGRAYNTCKDLAGIAKKSNVAWFNIAICLYDEQQAQRCGAWLQARRQRLDRLSLHLNCDFAWDALPLLLSLDGSSVHSLQLEGHVWPRLDGWVGQLPQLQSLEISTSWEMSAGTSLLQLSQLTRLALETHELTIAPGNLPPSLSSLSLKCLSADPFLGRLPALPALRELCVQWDFDPAWQREALRYLSASNLPCLTALEFNCPAGLPLPSPLSTLTTLRKLHISTDSYTEDEEQLAAMQAAEASGLAALLPLRRLSSLFLMSCLLPTLPAGVLALPELKVGPLHFIFILLYYITLRVEVYGLGSVVAGSRPQSAACAPGRQAWPEPAAALAANYTAAPPLSTSPRNPRPALLPAPRRSCGCGTDLAPSRPCPWQRPPAWRLCIWRRTWLLGRPPRWQGCGSCGSCMCLATASPPRSAQRSCGRCWRALGPSRTWQCWTWGTWRGAALMAAPWTRWTRGGRSCRSPGPSRGWRTLDCQRLLLRSGARLLAPPF